MKLVRDLFMSDYVGQSDGQPITVDYVLKDSPNPIANRAVYQAVSALTGNFDNYYLKTETSSNSQLNEAFNSYAKLSASNVFEADNTFKTGLNVGLRNTRASKSIVAGEDVHSQALCSYAWSGNGEYNIPESRSGTFNINPKGGLSGFYVGHKTLEELALTYQKFLTFTFTGTLGISLSGAIEDDTVDGGFYGMCYAGDKNVILGTYQSGLYFYNEFEGTIVPAVLKSLDSSITGTSLALERKRFKRYRFRRIIQGNDGFLAVNYQTSMQIKSKDGTTKIDVPEFYNKYHRCFYWSTDGYEWTLISHLESTDSGITRIESPLAYIGGKYFYSPATSLYSSSDGYTWTQDTRISTKVLTFVPDAVKGRLILILQGGEVWYLDIASNALEKQDCVIAEIASKGASVQSYGTFINNDVALIGIDNYLLTSEGPDKFKTQSSYEAQNINVAIDDYTKKQYDPVQTTFGVVRGITKAHDLWFLGTYHGFVMVSMDLKTWIPVYYEPLNTKERGGIEQVGIYDQQFHYITRCVEDGYPILKKLYIMNDTVIIKKLIQDYYTCKQIDDTCVKLSGDQDINGYKLFKDGLDVGDYINDVGNNTFAVGNDLTVGSYNFFYKGIDLTSSTGFAKVYLTTEQPRYPYPFVIYNGDKTKFKICGNDVTINSIATYSALSAGSALSPIWKCSLDPSPEHRTMDDHVWRPDYNQLSIDIGPTYYNGSMTDVQAKLNAYVTDAFSGDSKVKPYLIGKSLVGEQLTFVNGDKIAYLRCGKVASVIDSCVLCVNFKDTALGTDAFNDLTAKGSHGFSDFDFDDASMVFIDQPLLSGPANTSTYSSMNIGILNETLRRGSMCCGKQLTSEADFAIALGRRGQARHYATFLWAPASNIITTDKSGTFNIGLNATLANAHSSSYASDIRIIGNDNKRERLYKYVWGCLSSDATLKAEFKKWLGI